VAVPPQAYDPLMVAAVEPPAPGYSPPTEDKSLISRKPPAYRAPPPYPYDSSLRSNTFLGKRMNKLPQIQFMPACMGGYVRSHLSGHVGWWIASEPLPLPSTVIGLRPL